MLLFAILNFVSLFHFTDPDPITNYLYNGQVQLYGSNQNIKRALKLYIKKDQNTNGFFFVCAKPEVFTAIFLDTVCRQLGLTNSNDNETRSKRYSYMQHNNYKLVHWLIIINILTQSYTRRMVLAVGGIRLPMQLPISSLYHLLFES